MSADDELADVRRLLQETTERAQRLEMELELARRTAKDLEAKVLEMQQEVGRRLLMIFGCAACGGEHRGIWAQDLAGMPLGEPKKAYVCPEEIRIVVVPEDESREAFVYA